MGRLIECRHANGIEGIERALDQATDGDIVQVESGRYSIKTTLSVSSGVTLRGANFSKNPCEPETVFLHEHDAPAIQVIDAERVTLQSFSIQSMINEVVQRILPDATPTTDLDTSSVVHEWGVVWISESQVVAVTDLSLRCIDGSSGPLLGICARNSTAVTVERNAVTGYTLGAIRFASVQDGVVTGNEAEGSADFGISLIRSRSTGDPSRAEIMGNWCHGNQQGGIVLAASESNNISDNDCGDNGGVGIFLLSDSRSSHNPSCANLTRNRCYGHNAAGIMLFGSESDALCENECWDNGEAGIILVGSIGSIDRPSRAWIAGNRCHGNLSGIVLSSSISDGIKENECWGNRGSGIVLDRDSIGHRGSKPSSASITGNRCSGNEGAGILILSSDCDAVTANHCWNNGASGISLARYSGSPDQPSRANLIGNRCNGNGSAGINLQSADYGSLYGNDCWENGASGILLIRDDLSPKDPSRAEVVGNRCHGNSQAGVAIVSSEVFELANNELWGNGTSAIVLQPDSDSLEPSFCSEIKRNACYSNVHSGIELRSSDSTLISENNCWDNGMWGILLARDPKTASLPSKAKIVGNNCTENRHVGIALVSSVSERVAGNECWKNGIRGIVLQRDQVSPDMPSTALITDNRCHGNYEGYAAFGHQAVRATKNQNWGNENPPRFYPWGSSVPAGVLDWDFRDPGETAQQTAKRIRDTSIGGDLAEELSKQGFREPDLLARYVSCSGGLTDLKSWYGSTAEVSRAEIESPNLREMPVASELVPQNLYRLQNSSRTPNARTSETLRFVTESKSLTDLVWDRIRLHVEVRRPQLVLIGVIGTDPGKLNKLMSDLARGDDIDVETPGTTAGSNSEIRAQVMRGLSFSAQEIAQPVIFDYGDRSHLAIAGSDAQHPFPEPETATGWQAWRERAGFLSTDYRFVGGLLAFSVLIFIMFWGLGKARGFPTPWADPIGSIAFAVLENIHSLQVLDLLGILSVSISVVTGVGLGAFIWRMNNFLPSHLKIRRHRVRSSDPTDSGVGKGPERGRPWSRYVSKKIYRGGDIYTILVRNLVEWTNDDIIGLQEVVMLRPEHASLILLLETPSTATLDRAILRPLFDPKTGRTVLGGFELFLCVGPEPFELQLETSEAPDLPVLLGLQDTDDSALEAATADIFRPNLRLADLLPMLTVGSTLYWPYRLTMPVSETLTNFTEESAEDLRRSAAVMRASIDEISLESSALSTLSSRAQASSATRTLTRRMGRERLRDLIGRFQERDAMAIALRQVFEEDEQARIAYLAMLVACGERHALHETRQFLGNSAHSRPRLVQALMTLRSALILKREGERLTTLIQTQNDNSGLRTNPTTLPMRASIEDDWKETLSTIASLTIPKPVSPAQSFTAARLYAISCSVAPHVSSQLTSSFVGGCYHEAIESAEALFDDHDRNFAHEQALVRLTPFLSLLPIKEREALLASFESRRVHGTDLAQFLERATDAKSLRAVFKRHGDIADDVLATIFSLTAQYTVNNESKFAAAQTLNHLRDFGVCLSPAASPRGYGHCLDVSITTYLEILREPDTISVLKHLTNEAATQERDRPLVGLLYGGRGDLHDKDSDIVRIEFLG